MAELSWVPAAIGDEIAVQDGLRAQIPLPSANCTTPVTGQTPQNDVQQSQRTQASFADSELSDSEVLARFRLCCENLRWLRSRRDTFRPARQ